MTLLDYLRAAPKAELHVHLEGSVGLETLQILAKRNGVELPAGDGLGITRRPRYRDFAQFAETFVAVTSCLRAIEDYELIVYELGREMARQNVRYAEVNFSPSTAYARDGISEDVYLLGLKGGRARARADFGVEINWIFNIVRYWRHRSPFETLPLAEYTTRVAIEGDEAGVVALGLAGDEAQGPAEPFASYFEQARAAGLHSAPHAGEHAGAQSVWTALRVLGAERIGHGVRSIEDPELVAYLAEKGVPLEVCPTSNVCLRVYPSLVRHPLRRLYEAGVRVTVGSDDPAMFDTTVSDEIALLAKPFGLEVEAIDEILLNGVRSSFAPPERKQELESAFRSELAALKAAYL